MNIEEILDMLDELLDRAWNLPLSGGRCVIDAEKVREMVDDIRLNLPDEIKQAKAIVKDRTEILSSAKSEAEAIVRKAEERARVMIAQDEVMKQAQAKATEIVTQAQTKSKEIRQASQEFSDEVLRKAEESLAGSLAEVRQTRQALKGAQRQFAQQRGSHRFIGAQEPNQTGALFVTQAGAFFMQNGHRSGNPFENGEPACGPEALSIARGGVNNNRQRCRR